MSGVCVGGAGLVLIRVLDAASLQLRHRVHAPHLPMFMETSCALLAPKATAGFMNVAWSVRKQWVHRYNFFMGSVVVLVLALCLLF